MTDLQRWRVDVSVQLEAASQEEARGMVKAILLPPFSGRVFDGFSIADPIRVNF